MKRDHQEPLQTAPNELDSNVVQRGNASEENGGTQTPSLSAG
jgi:hypothetical protein